MHYLDSESLFETTKNYLENEIGVCSASSFHLASSLTDTSLRGVDSHGIRLLPHYCQAFEGGRLNKDPQFKFEQRIEGEQGSAVLDADHAVGHHAGAEAMNWAITSAQKLGVSAVNVKNSSHFGAAGYFAHLAAEQDCIGFAFTNGDALVKAHGSAEAFFGNHPICIVAPMKGEGPLCLDMGTGFVSWNKVLSFKSQGLKLSEGWAFDKSGQVTTDPSEAVSLSPAGDHKGYGLGMFIDVLCALLGGSALSKDIAPMTNTPMDLRRGVSHFFMALHIEHFVSITTFKELVQDMADRVRKMPASGEEPVMVAGDPEKKTKVERLETGIPVPDVVYSKLVELSEAFEQCKRS